MAKDWDPGSCNEKSGFLFNHECMQMPSDSCGRCQKPICADHTHLSDVDGKICTSCAKKVRQRGGRGKTASRASRSDRYDDHYDEPYFYGGYYFATFHHDRNDPNDFTEADAASLSAESDEAFENDMSES